jgi:hypothetical protein
MQEYNTLEVKLNANRTPITMDPRVIGVGISFDSACNHYAIEIVALSKIDNEKRRSWRTKFGAKVKLNISYLEPYESLGRSRYHSPRPACHLPQ